MLPTEKGKGSGFMGPCRGGWIVALPLDPSALVFDRRTATKSYHAPRRRLPFEHVALVSPSGLRRIVSGALEYLHHCRNLPYAHLWYYPDGAGSVFTWRVDTDYASLRDIERLQDLSRLNNVPVTWFVDVKSQEGDVPFFRRLEGDEVGIHCYEHEVYEDAAGNLENLRRAADIFLRHGLRPLSFAAPFGRWNIGLASAIDALAFEYSSEFSYDYDGLPTLEKRGGDGGCRLQVPVHPICIGSLRRQGFSESEMVGYFRAFVAKSIRMREPLMFYHHPKDGHEDVVRELFAVVRGAGITGRRMIDFARWWRERDAALDSLSIDDQGARLGSDAPAVQIHLTKGDGTETFVRPSPAADFRNMHWARKPEPVPLPGDIRRIRRFNPWIPLIRLEDRIFGALRP